MPRLKTIKNYTKYKKYYKYKTNQNIKKNQFTEQFLKGIGLFFSKTKNLQITFKQLNKKEHHENKDKDYVKLSAIVLRRYSNSDFFKDGINLFFTAFYQKKSAKILADFIGVQLKTMRKHKNFYNFLKKLIKNFIHNKYSSIKGIKIKISGRMNGAPRSKKVTMLAGTMSLQSINNSVDYATAVSHTKDGTFGVKIWVLEKKYKKSLCYLNQKKQNIEKLKKENLKN
jgi:hypothetical protein